MISSERRILVMWLIAIVVIARRDLRRGHPPHPHAFVGSAIVYGMASILSEVAPQPATYLAAGWTLRLIYLDLAQGQTDEATGGGRGRGPKKSPPPPPTPTEDPRQLRPIAQGVARPRRRRPVASQAR